MHLYNHILISALAVTITTLTATVHANPLHASSIQINLEGDSMDTNPNPDVIMPPTPFNNDMNHEFDDEEDTQAKTGLKYGTCYILRDKSGQALGSDGGIYNYYKFGGTRRIFQVCHSRRFCYRKGPDQDVSKDGQFFLWDPEGTPAYTNGGSWLATNLGGHTYPGFYPYTRYIQFKAKPRGKGAKAETMGNKDTVHVKLRTAKTYPAAAPEYLGLKVVDGYLDSSQPRESIPASFEKVSCPHDFDDSEVNSGEL